MKKHIIRAVQIVTLLIGLSLLLYPTVSDHINTMRQSRAIQSYNDMTSAMSAEEQQAILDAAHDYNRRIAAEDGAIYAPERVSGYKDTLDITGTGIMGYITIDKINIELPIYHGVDDPVLQVAVGHLPGTSLPVGGESTHAVLSGHRGLPGAKLFTDLDKLEEGDVFYVTVLSEVLTYQVDQIKTVTPRDVSDLAIRPGEDNITLLTCTPYGLNTHRLLIRGRRVETDEEYITYVANEVFVVSPLIVASVIALPILFVLLIIVLIRLWRFKKAQKTEDTKES